jgi:hypothetical protein
MDTPQPEPDLTALRSRLEPHFPNEGFTEHGREVAVKYLEEIETLNKEEIAILMAFQQIMIEQQTSIVENLAKKVSDDKKSEGAKEVSKIVQAFQMPKRRRF